MNPKVCTFYKGRIGVIGRHFSMYSMHSKSYVDSAKEVLDDKMNLVLKCWKLKSLLLC